MPGSSPSTTLEVHTAVGANTNSTAKPANAYAPALPATSRASANACHRQAIRKSVMTPRATR
jgi:hypothetical protein